VHRAQTSGGGGRYGVAALRRAGTRPDHLVVSAPLSSRRMTAELGQVPESSRRLVPWLQVTAVPFAAAQGGVAFKILRRVAVLILV
jgi:hypothetical protein